MKDVDLDSPSSYDQSANEPDDNVKEIERRKRNDLFYVFHNHVGRHSVMYSSRMNSFLNENSLEEHDSELIEAVEVKKSRLPSCERSIEKFYCLKT